MGGFRRVARAALDLAPVGIGEPERRQTPLGVAVALGEPLPYLPFKPRPLRDAEMRQDFERRIGGAENLGRIGQGAASPRAGPGEPAGT